MKISQLISLRFQVLDSWTTLSWVRLDRGITGRNRRTTSSSATVRTGTSDSFVRAVPRDSIETLPTQDPPPGAFPATVTDTRTSVMSTQVSVCAKPQQFESRDDCSYHTCMPLALARWPVDTRFNLWAT